MSPTIPGSLWPADIKAEIQSPLTILDIQAKALSRQTKGVLVGDVLTSYDKDKGIVYVSLDIVVPALNGLRRRILTASHRADMMYPVMVDAPDSQRQTGTNDSRDPLTIEVIEEGAASSDDDFLDVVAEILKSDEVVSLAVSLVAKANEAGRKLAKQASAPDK